MKTASVGVDVDSLWHYYRIHGLPDAAASNAVWRVGVPRFVALFERLGLPATFYCVADDLDVPGNTDRLRDLVARDFEIGNHSLHHRYDLTRLKPEDRIVEVGQGRYRLEMAGETQVFGFRAPGYNTDAGLLEDVKRTGHVYDSSVFPCLPYYGAKAAVMGLMRLSGRESRSILGTPRVLFAPRSPYRMDEGEPHARGPGGLTQFPISVVGGVPMLGTAFTAMGRRASTLAARLAVLARSHLTLEFHAVDLMSLRDDDLDSALSVQPDLKVSVDVKTSIFESVLRVIAEQAKFVRLCDLKVGEDPQPSA